MDLVTSYLSDDSETEKKSKETKTTQKVIDIIELEDTDPEMKDSESSPVKILKDPKPSSLIESDTKPVKVIECIDIGESDNEEPEQKNINDDLPKNISLESNSVSNKSQTNLKENDYLNLHDSDSDEEPIIIQDNVNNLLNSAAVLSDVQCGPKKLNLENASFSDVVSTPINKLDLESHTTASLVSKSFDSSSQCGSRINTPELSIISSDKNSTMADGTIHKRIKRETETPKSCTSATNVDVSEAEEFGMPSTYMYRKDERINGAFAKSVICRLPRQITRNYAAHSNSVTSLNWCIPQYSHLLLSASADGTVKIWDMYCKHPVQRLKSNLGLKAAKWSVTGEQIVTGGYGRKAHVYDVLSGKEIISYDVYHYANSIEIHPYIEDVFLCGTRNAIFGFDLRVNSSLPIRTFLSKCEEVLDIVFLDENEFICSTNVVSHDSADRTIMVWDFSTGAIMSNQIYLERYTCPSLKVHPYDSCFIAQTNGDYIASFSTCKPYKIKDRIYKGHKVSGFGIECDISPDGKYIASGDANGDVYFYSYNNANIINKLSIKSNTAVNKLKWHPALNSVMAVATWEGYVQIWK